MKTVRLISTFFHYLAKIAGLLYLVVGVYAAIAILFPALGMYGEKTGNGFTIYYPFTHSPFLLGESTNKYIAGMLGAIFLYGIFLMLLGEVFNAFRKQKLFTPENVARLSWFYTANLIIPTVVLLITIVLDGEVRDVAILAVLHFIIGIFAYFMTAIFKQGVVLQEEQDLTL